MWGEVKTEINLKASATGKEIPHLRIKAQKVTISCLRNTLTGSQGRYLGQEQKSIGTCSQFSLNPLDAKRAGVQEVHETSSTSARDVWYYSSRCSWQPEPLASAGFCGCSNDPRRASPRNVARPGHLPRRWWCAWHLSAPEL